MRMRCSPRYIDTAARSAYRSMSVSAISSHGATTKVEHLIGDHITDRVELACFELGPDAACRALEPEVIELERIVGGGAVERDLPASRRDIGCPFLRGIARACEDRHDQLNLARISPDLS